MIWSGVLGAALAAGVWMVVRGLVPSARPLQALSDELLQPRVTAPARSGRQPVRAWWHRLASRLAGHPSARRRADLAVLGRDQERHTLDKLGYGVVFGLLATVPVAALPLVSVGVSPPAGVLFVGLFAAAGWAVPDVELRSQALAARRSWARTLTVYVDIVGISLAGGAGVEDALMVAARSGSGPQFRELGRTLHVAQTRRQRLWEAIDDLGARGDVPALRELAAAVELAAESGSRIRETLMAKASAMRTRQLTEIEADAQKASETMGVAPALMAVAAVVLIGYPAVARFFSG